MDVANRTQTRSVGPPPARRLPLVTRARRAREAAAVRARARTTRAVTPAQRAYDPLTQQPSQRAIGRAASWLPTLLPILGALLLHGAVVGAGLLSDGERGQREIVEQQVKIEVRELPPPELPPTPPEVEAKEPTPPPPPKVVKAPPPKAPPEPEPAEPPKTPPPRVVGLSLESTAEGGGGPAFAVGNTRQGRTDDVAADPALVPKEAPSGEPLPGENKVASRLPSAGVKYTPPRWRLPENQRKPLYPETLKTQGIEADVKVSLSIDPTGKVTAVKILAASEYPEFNDAARAAAMKAEFEPATRDGEPIPYSLPFTYRFRLEEE